MSKFLTWKNYRLNKKTRLKGLRRLKSDLTDILRDDFEDLVPYILNDILHYLISREIVVRNYAKKNQTKNPKKKKSKKAKK